MVAKRKTKTSGGLKGFFSKAASSFSTGGAYLKDKSYWLAEKLAKAGFIVATASFVLVMPLIFEISREGQMIESEQLQVKELRSEGYADHQLRQMGFSDPAIARAPSVVLKK